MTTTSSATATLLKALQKRPRVLLLGQTAFRTEAGIDSLAEAFRDGGSAPKSAALWWLARTDDPGSRAEAFTRREALALAPPTVASAARLAWQWVLTSAIDGLTRKTLESAPGRTVHQITTARLTPPGADLPLYRLFGTVERSTADELPPHDSDALRRRRVTASEILHLLPDLSTPNGHLFVAGWDPSLDWLRPRDLSACLGTLGRGQVLIFGIGPPGRSILTADEDFSALLEQGIVEVFEESLEDLVSGLLASGSLPPDLVRASGRQSQEYVVGTRLPSPGGPSPIAHRSIDIPIRDWARITASLYVPLALDLSAPLPPVTAQQQALFRDLLATGPSPENVAWLGTLAFERSVLSSLLQQCLAVAATPLPQDASIIVYGQAGSGKTVLLSQLMLKLRHAGFPVAYSRHSNAPLDQTLVDDFCGVLAQNGAPHLPLFLIHDANQEESEYTDVAAFLSGRNRKCVVVGSALPAQARTPSSGPRRRRITVSPVSLPSSLDTAEQAAFVSHFSRFSGLPKEAILRLLGVDLSHFFAAIYRLAPGAREPLKTGLLYEFLEGASRMQQHIESLTPMPPAASDSPLAIALRKAMGAALDEALARLQEKPSPSGAAETTQARTLIDAVMVSSRLGLQVPQSLALRLIGHSIPVYRGTMEGDILLEHEVSPAIFTLSARHPIEAQLWVASKLPEADSQFDLIAALTRQLRPGEALEDCPELEFVVQLLHAVGPEGDERFRMRNHYADIAELISQLSRSHDVHPRLLLHEAHCIREAIKEQQRGTKGTDWRETLESWQRSLEQADDALRKAVRIVSSDSRAFRTRSATRLLATLNTERSAVIGFLMGSTIRLVPESLRSGPEWTRRLDSWLDDARGAWREALRHDSESIYAISTGCWILNDRIRATALSPSQEAVLLAEWSSLIDRFLDLDLPPHQLDSRDRAEREFASRVGDTARLSTVIDRADKRGSAAIRVLEAREMERATGPTPARLHLETHCSQVLLSDREVLLAYFRLWWRTDARLGHVLPKRTSRDPFLSGTVEFAA